MGRILSCRKGGRMSEVADKYAVHPPSMRWTHIALPCIDIDKTIAWYERFTPLDCSTVARMPTGTEPGWATPIRSTSPSSWCWSASSVIRPRARSRLWRRLLTSASRSPAGRRSTPSPSVATGRAVWPGRPRKCRAHRVHLCADGSRRQHDRVLLQPRRVRDRAGGVGERVVTHRPGSPIPCASLPRAFASGDPDAVARS